ncbi:hypothetical protein CEXT_10431 [Caerostris extrusa]|uniref:Uncharacterized protein n=1 Tax=Caerostris extrusa TaxID=172846 RepID=A0AAV4XAK5_CAEEX|nr:hypothetical protein CEXT_10431 [Caerostris extrusa]
MDCVTTLKTLMKKERISYVIILLKQLEHFQKLLDSYVHPSKTFIDSPVEPLNNVVMDSVQNPTTCGFGIRNLHRILVYMQNFWLNGIALRHYFPMNGKPPLQVIKVQIL